MIVRSPCKHPNMAGSMFCAECHAQLVGKGSLIAPNTIKKFFFKPTAKIFGDDRFKTFDGSDSRGSRPFLPNTGQVFPLSSQLEFTSGRKREGQSNVPDMDLSPCQAYAAEGSRLYAI